MNFILLMHLISIKKETRVTELSTVPEFIVYVPGIGEIYKGINIIYDQEGEQLTTLG